MFAIAIHKSILELADDDGILCALADDVARAMAHLRRCQPTNQPAEMQIVLQ